MTSLRKYIYDAFDEYLDKENTLLTHNIKNNEFLIKENNLERFYRKPEHIVDLLIWPPNTFLILTNLLDKNGHYRKFVSPDDTHGWSKKHLSKALELSIAWRKILTEKSTDISQKTIDDVISSLQELFSYKILNSDVSSLLTDKDFIIKALTLTIASDETFNFTELKISDKESIYKQISNQLGVTYNSSKSQLSFSNHHFGTIQRKSAVCQSGISLNSISNNITNIRPEISLELLERPNETVFSNDIYNILILPWPMNIERGSFTEVTKKNILEMDGNFGFFSYTPDEEIDINNAVTCVIDAIRSFGDIDLIVLPECALSAENSQSLAEMLSRKCNEINIKCPTIITGNYDHCDHYSKNQITIFSSPEKDPDLPDIQITLEQVTQKKHHRWYLDRTQIFNYKLGSNLSPNKKWWEFIDVDERKLINYQCHDNKIQITPLICEDLARQDPVAPAVRALGPTLIIALLLDGPQLKTRWPGRYASFLSEDPGSSVLTVTPLGMTLRSDGSGLKPSRVVSFWSEPGSYRELSLEENKQAIILTLEKRDILQWTADGRQGKRTALHYAGHVCV